MIIAQNCHDLRLIDFRYTSVTDVTVLAIAIGCHKLITVHFCFCETISDVGLLGLTIGLSLFNNA